MDAPDNKVQFAKVRKMSDDELKALMIQTVYDGTTIKRRFDRAPDILSRCWQLLCDDVDFSKKYENALLMYVKIAEEELLTGAFLENIPEKVDKLGNADLAAGHLRRAELHMKRMQWILERRMKQYQPKGNLAEAVEAGAKIIIEMPEKESDEAIVQ
jgi:hypothetical protein